MIKSLDDACQSHGFAEKIALPWSNRGGKVHLQVQGSRWVNVETNCLNRWHVHVLKSQIFGIGDYSSNFAISL